MTTIESKDSEETIIIKSSVQDEPALEIVPSDIAFVKIDSASPDSATVVYLTGEHPDLSVKSFKTSKQSLLQLANPTVSSKFIANLPFSDIGSPSELHLIINPVSGAKHASTFYSQVIKPLLELANIKYTAQETKQKDDAAVIASSFRGLVGERTIAILGGDGTTHELVNGLLSHKESLGVKSKYNLVLLPFGTANAYYYHLFPPESLSFPSTTRTSSLYSLLSFLSLTPGRSGDVRLRPLSLASNVLLPSSPTSSDPRSQPETIFTTVVTSTALHSALLADAESLRDQYPGVERFKVAAAQNVTKWTEGKLRLLSSGGATSSNGPYVEKYDLRTKRFIPVREDETTLEGPFSYLVSSLVSRFESNFVVAPHRSPLSPLSPTLSTASSYSTIDLVIIRPLRDLATAQLVKDGKQPEAADKFVAKVWEVTAGMYGGGTHLDVELKGQEGVGIVEYYRATGFEWEPLPNDSNKHNHLVCLDGDLKTLELGGKLRTVAISGNDDAELRIWDSFSFNQ
ncbi:hypothetical protein T439DRAFT_324399 [Meredithblackwellia eburnea MCA 4105]